MDLEVNLQSLIILDQNLKLLLDFLEHRLQVEVSSEIRQMKYLKNRGYLERRSQMNKLNQLVVVYLGRIQCLSQLFKDLEELNF